MPEFNSGYRAAVGLPLANHDPEPYLWESGGRTDAPSRWGGSRNGRYRPRRKFDMPDNPILVSYRHDIASRGDDAYWGDSWDSYVMWLDLARASDQYCQERGFTQAMLDHARRVLAKLAALA